MKELQIIFLILSILILIMMGIKLGLWVKEFVKELRYLNSEIARTVGTERQYWINRKKRLFKSLLPFSK